MTALPRFPDPADSGEALFQISPTAVRIPGDVVYPSMQTSTVPQAGRVPPRIGGQENQADGR